MKDFMIAGMIAGFATLISVTDVSASDGAFLEIDCKEYYALTGYRVCAVQQKVWIRDERYQALRVERDRKLCRAEVVLTYGRNVCLSDPQSQTMDMANGQRQCVASLDQCDIRHSLDGQGQPQTASLSPVRYRPKT